MHLSNKQKVQNCELIMSQSLLTSQIFSIDYASQAETHLKGLLFSWISSGKLQTLWPIYKIIQMWVIIIICQWYYKDTISLMCCQLLCHVLKIYNNQWFLSKWKYWILHVWVICSNFYFWKIRTVNRFSTVCVCVPVKNIYDPWIVMRHLALRSLKFIYEYFTITSKVYLHVSKTHKWSGHEALNCPGPWQVWNSILERMTITKVKNQGERSSNCDTFMRLKTI